MPESDRDKTIEVMAHALCPFTDELDGPCMKCPQDEVGPNGGRRGCMWINAKAADAILSALQASGMAVVPGWQPIESAPKDGTRIILAWGGKSVTGSYLDNGHTDYPWKGWRVPSLELTPPGAPISWMPFPEVARDKPIWRVMYDAHTHGGDPVEILKYRAEKAESLLKQIACNTDPVWAQKLACDFWGIAASPYGKAVVKERDDE